MGVITYSCALFLISGSDKSTATILEPTLVSSLYVNGLKNPKGANFPRESPPQLKQRTASMTLEERDFA